MKFITPEISWHSRDPLYSVDLQNSKGKVRRLATCGTDKLVRMWEIKLPQEETVENASKDRAGITVEFLSSLSRHSRTVNVVRFSPDGSLLASGADDSAIILWRLSDVPPSANLFQDDEEENRETWNAFKVLRSHLEDVYDLSWSADGRMLLSGSVDNTAILWDVKKGHKLWMFSEHKSFVQGVAFDPLCGFLATMSDDRSCRIYSFEKRQLLHDVKKLPVELVPATLNDAPAKSVRMFHSADTMKSFFRRLSFSPDGQILVVPAGCIEGSQSVETISSTTYVFSRSNLSKPVISLVGPLKPTLAIRFCPILYELRKVPRCRKSETPAELIESETNSKENELEWNKYETLFKLPYRMIYAVISENAVILYDTQQPQPIALLENLHYHTLSDATWSHDGRLLVVSSTDGYCSLISFSAGELGTEYKDQVPELLLQASLKKEMKDEPTLLPKPTTEAKPCDEKVLQNASQAVAGNELTKQLVKSDVPKPVKKCSTNLLSVFKKDAAGGPEQPAPKRPKPNLVQPTIFRRVTPIAVPLPVPVNAAPLEEMAKSADVEEPMDIGEISSCTSNKSPVVDCSNRLCSVDIPTDLHLELELTNDVGESAPSVSAVIMVPPSVLPSSNLNSVMSPPSVIPSSSLVSIMSPPSVIPSSNLVSVAEPTVEVPQATNAVQSSGKNPRRIQLTTIKSLR